MATDDLSAPLGQGKAPKRPGAVPHIVPRAIVGLLSLSVIAVAGWAMIADDPFGGEPMAVAPVHLAAAGAAKKAADASARASGSAERPNRYDGPPPQAATTASAPPATPAGKTITIIDGTSGKRQEVVLPGTGADAPSDPALDPRLAEMSPHGPLPKIAADGSRASDIYARPVKASGAKPNSPRIAIVVGGLGIGGAATADALAKLPGPVTLALAPYGGNLVELAARARRGGHEVLLQVPMEPFDYPDNDPGPHTLLTSLDAAQNLDRLQWLMGRFQGYVGIVSQMGARFTASESALAPVMREAGSRGLLYFDDGASQRSVADRIAGANNLPFAKADLTIDSVATAADVERALGRLETTARERGAAVGMASALPVSIERIAKWAKAAEGRGVLLVPISALARPTSDDRRRMTENGRQKAEDR